MRAEGVCENAYAKMHNMQKCIGGEDFNNVCKDALEVKILTMYA